MKNNLFNRVINRVFAGSLPTVDRRSNYTSSTRHRVACILFVLFFAIPQMWGALTSTHVPGIYEKAVADGGFGIDLTTYNNEKYEVYYFSANSKYGTTCTGADKQQQRLMAADSDSEHILFSSSSTGAPWAQNIGWIETNFATTGFAKSDYSYGTTTFNEFFAVAPNGGNSGNNKTCFIKPKEGDSFSLKVSGYSEFAILSKDNSTSKYVQVTVDGGTPSAWKSTTLARHNVSLTTSEHTIVVSIVGGSASNIYGFSLKVPSAAKYNYSFATGDHGTTAPDGGNDSEVTLPSMDNVDGWDFDGWKANQDVKVGTETKTEGTLLAAGTKVTLTAATTFTAQWKVASVKYAVTFDANSGSGEMDALQKAEGDVVTLPACTFTAPDGKGFDKWVSDDVTISEGEFTMPGNAVTVKATWKAIPTVLFYYQWSGSSSMPSMESTLTATGGSIEVNRTGTGSFTAQSWSSSVAGTPDDLKLGSNSNKKSVKFANNDPYFGLSLSSGNFQSGDTLYIGGHAAFYVSSSVTSGVNPTGDIGTLTTNGTGTSNLGYGYLVLPQVGGEDVEFETIYLSRKNGASAYFAAVKVVRPAAKEILSTAGELYDVKVAGTSISVDDLAALKANHTLTLSEKSLTAPEITFVEKNTITYVDHTTKVKTQNVAKTAEGPTDKFFVVSETINGVEYIVKAPQKIMHNINYEEIKEGAEPESPLPTQYEEGVGIASFPAMAGAQGWSFKGWNPASIGTNATGDVTITATWEQVQSHDVKYYPGEGSGTAGGPSPDKGATVEVATFESMYFTAPEEKTFRHWTVTSGLGEETLLPGDEFTMPDNNVILTAYYDVQHTVTFMDGEEIIGSANVWDGEKLVVPAEPQKPLAKLDKWKKGDVEYNFDTPVTESFSLLATWTKTYAQSYDIEAYVAEHGIEDNDAFRADFVSKGYALNSPDNLDTYNYDPSKAFSNYPYVGLKFKAVGGGIEANVEAAKLVTIKLGHMAANADLIINDDEANKKSLAGIDAATPKVHYFYSDAEANYKLQMTSGSTCVLKAFLISDPFEVTFSNGGTIDPMYFKGTALELPEATGDGEFQGWFTLAEGGDLIGKAGESYTPTASIELFAQFSPCSTNNEIVSFQFGETVITATEGKRDYAIELPYKTAIPETLTYTQAEETATAGDVTKAENVFSFIVTSECGVPANYTVTFTVAPKDPVCIIHADITGQRAASVDPSKSAFEGTATANSNVKNATTYEDITGYKFNSEGARMSVTLADAYGSFKEGDIVKMFITTVQAMPIRAYSDESASNEVVTGAANMVLGINSAVLTADASTLWLARTGTNGWNPNVAYVEVLRPMNPILTKMEIDNRAADVVDNACSIMLPYEADLANLTVNPTIFANEVQSIVINDDEGWKMGDNTYKIIDKDGDESVVYTITLARDVLKYTVTFDVQGGAPAIEPQDVVAGETITPVATPEKWDNSFLGWSMNEDPTIVEDITAVAINAATTFKANWGPETDVIKLIDGEGNLNTTDFITGATMAAGVTVQYQGADLPVARLGGTASSVSGVNQLNKVIEYVPTTTKTKMMIVANNNTTSARQVIVSYVLEGETTASTTTYDLGNKELINTGYVEYNSESRRSIYLTVPSSVASVDFLQVKVIESGEPLVKVGEPGYSINLNKGRLIAASGADYTFEGITFNLSSGYGCISNEYAVTKTAIKFSVANDVTLKVTTSNTTKYNVTTTDDGTDNETTPTANVASEFNLTAGTWYIRSNNGTGVNLTNIAFAKPNAPKPEITAISEGTYCQGDEMPELTVTASAASGELHYQWYKVADGGDIEVGEDATYTPDADATYYVVVTNKKEGYNDATAQSETVEVKSVAGTAILGAEGGEARDGQTVTLSVEAEGKNLTYAWFTCDEGGNISGDQLGNGATLQVTIAGADAYYKVFVNSDCGEEQSAVVLAKMWIERTQTPVSESTVWDFSKVSNEYIELTSSTTPKKDQEYLMANIDGVNNNADFNSQALLFAGQHIRRDGNHVAGRYLKLTTTVPGKITVTFSDNGNNGRHIDINGQESEASSGTGDEKTYFAAVDAGEIMIKGENAGADDVAYVRIYKIEFQAAEVLRDNLTIGHMYTTCKADNMLKVWGAGMYEPESFDGIYVNFVEAQEVKAGYGYLLVAEAPTVYTVYGEEHKDEAVADAPNGMQGTLENITLPEGSNYCGVKNNHLQYFGANNTMSAEHAYIVIDKIGGTSAPVSARRLRVGPDRNMPTSLDNIEFNESDVAVKFIHNNQLYILREGKLFNAQGAKMR